MRFILQAVTPEHHLAALKEVLAIPAPTRVIISVGFLNKAGLSLVETELAALAGVTTILAGVRNGITSAQGLKKVVDLGCRTFVVDTGTRVRTFHPKIYYARNADGIRLIVGSANLTAGGLTGNIEASILQNMTFAEEGVTALSKDLEGKIDGMIAEYPQHVVEVTTNHEIDALLESGRVVDEVISIPPTPASTSQDRDLDAVPKMQLKTPPPIRPSITPATEAAAEPAPDAPAPAALAAAPVHAAPALVVPPRPRFTLVWESSPLTRRYLTIPTGAKTNPTGSMLFTKGALENIDQRHYFREEVFAELDWHFDPRPTRAHIERAEGKFQLVIKNVDYGVFPLLLSHNARTDTAAYAQYNSMTQLHWGEARPLVAREDLLDRIMYLYRDESAPGSFVLEID